MPWLRVVKNFLLTVGWIILFIQGIRFYVPAAPLMVPWMKDFSTCWSIFNKYSLTTPGSRLPRFIYENFFRSFWFHSFQACMNLFIIFLPHSLRVIAFYGRLLNGYILGCLLPPCPHSVNPWLNPAWAFSAAWASKSSLSPMNLENYFHLVLSLKISNTSFLSHIFSAHCTEK